MAQTSFAIKQSKCLILRLLHPKIKEIINTQHRAMAKDFGEQAMPTSETAFHFDIFSAQLLISFVVIPI